MPETESTEAVESSAADTGTDTTATESVEESGAVTSAEDGKTTEKPQMIPKTRFNEVIGQRNAAQEENKTLKERLDAIEARVAPKQTTSSKLPEPPSSITDQREIVDWYIAEGFERHFQDKFGMDTSAAKAVLQSSTAVAQRSQEQQWKDACRENKLDPLNKIVQATVMGLVQGAKMPLDDAVAEAAKHFSTSNGKKEPVATVPQGTQSGVMTQSDHRPSTPEEALQMAREGKVVKHRDTLAVLSRKRK